MIFAYDNMGTSVFLNLILRVKLVHNCVPVAEAVSCQLADEVKIWVQLVG